MSDKFSQSLQMLKDLKEQHFKLEDEKNNQSEELIKLKELLVQKEEELEKKKIQEQEEQEERVRRAREEELRRVEEDREPVRERQSERKEVQVMEQSHISQNINDFTTNTLREISDLKSEIVKLTTSLRKLDSHIDLSDKKKFKEDELEENNVRRSMNSNSSLKKSSFR